MGIDARLQVIGIRRRVRDERAPPQGKRIAGCTRWRYQAVVTSMDGLPGELWPFYNGRADCERVFRTARQALGMGNLISQRFRANEVAFMLRPLAMNVDLRFQLDREDKAQTAVDRGSSTCPSYRESSASGSTTPPAASPSSEATSAASCPHHAVGEGGVRLTRAKDGVERAL